MEQHELILVPKRDFDENADCWQSYANNGEFDDFFQWWFSLSENEALWPVYQALNDSLNTGIDHYEDAEIPANNVEKAISVAETFRNNNVDCSKNEAFEKLMQAFQKAKELGQPIYFWF